MTEPTATTIPEATPTAQPTTATTPTTATPPSTGEEGKVEFTPAQQKELDRIAAAARKEGRDAANQAAADKAAADKATKDAADAEARGEFDTVKGTLQKSIDDLTTDRDTLKAKVESYDAILTPLVKERHDALKAADAEVAQGFPADADPLTQLAWLDDPRTKAVLAKQDERADALRLWPNTPPPNGNGKPEVKSLVDRRQAGFG